MTVIQMYAEYLVRLLRRQMEKSGAPEDMALVVEANVLLRNIDTRAEKLRGKGTP